MTATAVSTEPLVDSSGRVHRDLRVSLTDRCNLRCTYCMPADFADWLPGPSLLTTDEMMLVVGVAVVTAAVVLACLWVWVVWDG